MPKFGNGLRQGLGLLLDINEERFVIQSINLTLIMHSIKSYSFATGHLAQFILHRVMVCRV